jgi:hypothetical protein
MHCCKPVTTISHIAKQLVIECVRQDHRGGSEGVRHEPLTGTTLAKQCVAGTLVEHFCSKVPTTPSPHENPLWHMVCLTAIPVLP